MLIAKRDIEETLADYNKDAQYQVIEVLKDGSRARTEKVRSISNDTRIFVRKYLKLVDPDEDSRALIHEILASANIPNAAKVYECYQLADDLVVISEYVEGLTLGEYVLKSHPLPSQIIISIFSDLASALSALHNLSSHTIVHRDITPSNIVIYQNEQGLARAKLIDFGISRLFSEEKERDTQALGTRGFASPEQYGFGQTSPRSDIYGLGALLYFCLTGENPSNNVTDKLETEQNIPAGVKAVMRKALAINPSDRHNSTNDFLADLKASASQLGAHRRRSIKSAFVEHPRWWGLQKSSWLRRAWNAILAFFAIFFFEVALIDPLKQGIKTHSELMEYLVGVLISLLFFLPIMLMSADLFGFHKRFKAFQDKQSIAVILSVSLVSAVVAILALALLSVFF